MRGLKSTLALLVVLLGLGGYIYFVLAKKPDSTVTKQEKLFPALEASKIDDLKVKSESGDVTSLKKDGGAGRSSRQSRCLPRIPTRPESPTRSATSRSSGSSTRTRPTSNRTDSTPRASMSSTSRRKPKPSGHLLVGAKAAAGGNFYARREDQKRVVLIAQYHESSLNKSTFDLRDKSIIKFDRTKVDGVDVKLDTKAMEFTKANADWKMVKPIAARADFSAVDGLVGRVESAQMKTLVTSAPTPAELKTYGFDKPQAVVNLHLGSAKATLEIGGKANDTTTYVRDTSKPDIFTIDNSSADDFKKPADDYRKKELFDFRAFDATHVELTKNGQTVIFERVKAKDDKSPDTWHRVSPNPGDPDRSKVEGLLAGLADIRARSFVDSTAKTGLQSPALVVDAKFDDGKKQEKVTFGKNGADAFASRPDDPGAAKIEAEKLDEAIKALDELSK